MVVSHVGAVWPLETVAPLSGAVLSDVRWSCSDSEASDDDVLSVGPLVPMNWADVCCARLDDFNWVVSDCVSDILSSGRDIEVGLTNLTHDIKVLPDVFPVMSAGAAAVPMPLPAVAEPVPQVVLRREAIPVVVSLAEEMTLCVAMIGLIEDGSDLPAELLDSEPVLPDCCFIDVGMLVPESSPVVSARGAAVPTSFSVTWLSVLRRCASGLGCLKLVRICLLRHCLLFCFCRSGRFGRNLPGWRDLLARALRVLCGCADARLRGCAEEFTGVEELVGAEDWGYIRPVADDDSPVCVRPVTGSHLFRSPLGRVLGLWQPHLPFKHLSWTVLGDSHFSCPLFWWDMMSARMDLCWTRLKQPRRPRNHCQACLLGSF